jgi:hypothetical protein
MPMPKPQSVDDLTIHGRKPKTLDIKVVKLHKVGQADAANKMAELAKRARGVSEGE